MKKYLSWRYLGIPLGLFSILLFFVFKTNPDLAEKLYSPFYSNYQKIRSFFSILPDGSLFYVPLFVVAVLFLFNFRKLLSKKQNFVSFLLFIVSIVGYAIFYFYTFWGYNYTRPSLESRLGLVIEAPDSTEIFDNLRQSIEQLNAYRSAIAIKDTLPWYDDSFNQSMQKKLSGEVANFIRPFGYKTNFKSHVNELLPKGVLRRFGSAGMYSPWSGEAYFDSGVPLVSRPNVFAHELGHVYGITNEGECNFVAYQAGIQTQEPLVQYSAALSYYRYASSAAYLTDSVECRKILNNLSPMVVADMRSKKKCGLLYPDFFPKARDQIYDQYLKTQGVKTGIEDYSKVYLLVNAWNKEQN